MHDFSGVDRETPKNLVPDESIPAAEKSVEGEKEAEGKVPKPASESKEKTAKEEL